MRFPILRSILIAVAAGTVAGAVVIAGLSFGLYGWPVFVVATVSGFAGGIPLGLRAARRMRAAPPIRRPASPSMDPEAAWREVNPMARVPYPPARTQGRA